MMESPPEPEEPKTPDEAGDVTPKQSRNLPSAPNGKPKAPPLFQRKVKPAETGVEEAVNSGSKIPLLKTKQTDHELKIEERKRASNHNFRSLTNIASKRDVKTKADVGRLQIPDKMKHNVEKVKVSKGIEMKRIVQDGNGLVPKRYNPTGLSRSSTTKTKDSSHTLSNNMAHKKKLTKMDPFCPSGVKSFTSVKNVPSKIKKSHDSVTATTKNAEVMTSKEEKPTESAAATVDDAISSFKTVDEFMNMPETALPEPSTNKKTLYKSKFWEFIDPNSKSREASKSKDTKKRYDSGEVKSFMQKRKEDRKQQLLKESKEKQEETEKRQRMLKELNSKCQRIALKGKMKSDSLTANQNLNHDESQAKKRKIELESPSLKYLRPLLEHKHSGGLIRKSETLHSSINTAKHAHQLLTEFENIVKRECISFLERIPIPTELHSPTTVSKVDKSVGTSVCNSTSASINQEISSGGSNATSKLVDEEFSKSSHISPKVEKAVIKIQAFYRGYKVRRVMKHAKVLLSRSSPKPDELLVHHQPGKPRRWSFPKLPEKPYDHNYIRYNKPLPMSPIPMSSAKSSDPLIACYIPPPPPASQTSKSPSRPKVLPSSPFTSARLRVYDEPYPRQVLKKMETSASGSGTRCSLPPDFADFVVPTPLPSIVDVLREKIRLFSASTDRLIAGEPIDDDDVKNRRHSHYSPRPEKIPESMEDRAGGISSDVGSQESSTLCDETDGTPRIIKNKRRSRSKQRTKRKNSSSAASSTTTIDTDLDFAPGLVPHRHSAVSFPTPSNGEVATPNSSKSEGTLDTSAATEPSVTSTLGEFLAPALRLRYEAEREHLKIIEKALQVKLHHTKPIDDVVRQKQTTTKASPEADRVQLAIANCHKESLKAAAEMSKWMADFQKTTQQQQNTSQTQTQQASVNLAAMVYAAVEEARVMGEENRREKAMRNQSRFNTSLEQAEEKMILREMKADKSVETSLTLYQQKEIIPKPPISEAKPFGILKDYQQQFPSASESERGSPALIPDPRDIGKEKPVETSNHPSVKSEKERVSQFSNVHNLEPHVENKISSPPISPLNTLMSTSIPSEECSVETPDIDLMQDLSELNDISASKHQGVDVRESSVEEAQKPEDPSYQISDVERSGGSDFLSGDILSDIQYENSVIISSAGKVSLEISSTDEKEEQNVIDEEEKRAQSQTLDEEKNSPIAAEEKSSRIVDEEKSSRIIDEESVTGDQEQFPTSTFESDINSTTTILTEQPEEGEKVPTSPPVNIVEETENELNQISSLVISQNESNHEEERSSSTTKVDTQLGSHPAAIKKDSDVFVAPESKEMATSEQSVVQKDEISTVEGSLLIDVNISENFITDVESEYSSKRDNTNGNDQGAQVSLKVESTEKECQAESKSNDDGSQSKASSLIVTDVIEDEEHVYSSITGEKLQFNLNVDNEGPLVSDDLIILNASFEAPPPLPLTLPLPDPTTPINLSTSFIKRFEPPLPLPESELESKSDEIIDPDPLNKTGIEIGEEILLEDDEEGVSTSTQAGNVCDDVKSEDEDESAKKEIVDIDEKVENTEEIISEPVTAAVVQTQQEESETLSSSTHCQTAIDDTFFFQKMETSAESSKPDIEIPLKPPPPYSPPSSLDSTSLSSKSLLIYLKNEKIEQVVQEQAGLIWKIRENNVGNKAEDWFPELNAVWKDSDQKNNDHNRNENVGLAHLASQNFDALIQDLVYKTIKEVFLVKSDFSSYIEKVRPGPLKLQAEKQKIPQTKERLINVVLPLVKEAIPFSFFPESEQKVSTRKVKGKKFQSRRKELVDEILLEELTEEDYQWTEYWPEEVLAINQTSKRIIHKLIQQAIGFRRFAFRQ